MIGKGPSARSVRLPLKRFTLVGATTRAGMLSSPLRDRFGMSMRLEMYTAEELSLVVNRSAGLLNSSIEKGASLEIGKRSRGTPRIANRLLKRVRDFATEQGSSINMPATLAACKAMEVDELGLDKTDRTMLAAIIKNFKGGPVGLSTLAAYTGEDKETIEDIYEPYLMQIGFLSKTTKGRIALEPAYKHLNFSYEH
jgi:Holliday junction DNA helicase RuvB